MVIYAFSLTEYEAPSVARGLIHLAEKKKSSSRLLTIKTECLNIGSPKQGQRRNGRLDDRLAGAVTMMRRIARWLAIGCLAASTAFAQNADSLPAVKSKPAQAAKMTAQELAEWIDERFDREYERLKVAPAAPVDDATFLRRVYLDLQGRIPTVAQTRDFLADQGSFKRADYVDRLLSDDSRPDRFARRSSESLARVWRRMMIPSSSAAAAMGPQIEPWLARQFGANTPYDELARKLLLARQPPAMPGLTPTPAPMPQPGDPDAEAILFQQAVGQMPENLAGAFTRVFLGVRLNCAQCHDHPFTDWTPADFWGVAAFFGGQPDAAPAEPGKPPMPMAMPPQPMAVPTIQATGGSNGNAVYTAKLLWEKETLKEIPAGKTPRELLAEWLVSPQNPNFAATAVNRVWQYLCGRGLAGSVDELDRVTPEERKILDELAKLFVESGYDVRWLITGICKSRVYQQSLPADPAASETLVERPLKTLLPEQVFDSLEQALSLPIAKADNGPRWSGEREQFVARMNEAAPESPVDYKGGIPQALMLMNGKLTADATSLDASRTLRAVIEAPFLRPEEKIETLYLAAVTRKPTEAELKYLLDHVKAQKAEDEQKQAYARILWGLLNSPEFVLSR